MAETAATTKDVTKAVIPRGGLGTRFLPATQGDAQGNAGRWSTSRPSKYVVEEAVAAGLDDVLMITGRARSPSRTTSTGPTSFEEALAAKGDVERLAQVRESSGPRHRALRTPGRPRGSVTPCSARPSTSATSRSRCCSATTSSTAATPLLTQMIEVRKRYCGSVVALMEVDPEQVSQYGSAAITPTAEEGVVHGHRPGGEAVPGAAPSNWILIGRYVCDPAVFDVLRENPARAGRRDPAHRRAADAGQARPGRRWRRARLTVPRPPLRHRQTSWTTCVRWSSSPASAPTWPRRSCPGCANTWIACRDPRSRFTGTAMGASPSPRSRSTSPRSSAPSRR